MLRYNALHFVTLRYIALHCVTLRYITLHYVTLRYITLHCATLRYITLHYVALRCYVGLLYIKLFQAFLPNFHYVTLSYIPWHFITWNHFIILHFVTIRYIPLHCFTLQVNKAFLYCGLLLPLGIIDRHSGLLSTQPLAKKSLWICPRNLKVKNMCVLHRYLWLRPIREWLTKVRLPPPPPGGYERLRKTQQMNRMN